MSGRRWRYSGPSDHEDGYDATLRCGAGYQPRLEKHLHRYLAEFDFRYNHREKLGHDDESRSEPVLYGVAGKRLTYRDSRVR